MQNKVRETPHREPDFGDRLTTDCVWAGASACRRIVEVSANHTFSNTAGLSQFRARCIAKFTHLLSSVPPLIKGSFVCKLTQSLPVFVMESKAFSRFVVISEMFRQSVTDFVETDEFNLRLLDRCAIAF